MAIHRLNVCLSGWCVVAIGLAACTGDVGPDGVRTSDDHLGMERVGLELAAGRPPGVVWQPNRAVALRWAGYADTRIDSATFLNDDFTLSVWVMPQYPTGYWGSIVTNRSRTFVFGQRPYIKRLPWLLHLKFGGAKKSFITPSKEAGRWRHLAVVRRGVSAPVAGAWFSVYVDGNLACPRPYPPSVCNLFVPSPLSTLSSNLRIGRDLPTQAGNRRQFYGLVDDVAVFKRALTEGEVRHLATTPVLSRDEPDLFRLINFDERPPARPTFFLRDSAYVTGVSLDRNDELDAQRLPLPDPRRFPTAVLPFRPGQSWRVSQGYGGFPSGNGSHTAKHAFSYDFILTGTETAGKPPNPYCPSGRTAPSCGEPLMFSTAGTVYQADDDGGDVPDDFFNCGAEINDDFDGSNVVRVDYHRLGARVQFLQRITYMHLQTGSVGEILGENFRLPLPVERGRPFARVGTRNGCHLHMAFHNGSIVYPAAFHDYQACDQDCTQPGNWYSVARGIPLHGQQVRRPLRFNDDVVSVPGAALR